MSLLGLTFLKDAPDGQKYHVKVVEKLIERDEENEEIVKFKVTIGGSESENSHHELIAYNELSDLVVRQHEAEASGEINYQPLKGILDHEGPLTEQKNPDKYKGSSYNVLMEWEDGSQTWEPLTLMMKDDIVTCANYAKEHNLLETPGWKRLKCIANHSKLYQHMVNQLKMKSKCRGICYKFGVQVPHDYKEAMRLDKENGNTLWQDTVKLEISQVHGVRYIPRSWSRVDS